MPSPNRSRTGRPRWPPSSRSPIAGGTTFSASKFQGHFQTRTVTPAITGSRMWQFALPGSASMAHAEELCANPTARPLPGFRTRAVHARHSQASCPYRCLPVAGRAIPVFCLCSRSSPDHPGPGQLSGDRHRAFTLRTTGPSRNRSTGTLCATAFCSLAARRSWAPSGAAWPPLPSCRAAVGRSAG